MRPSAGAGAGASRASAPRAVPERSGAGQGPAFLIEASRPRRPNACGLESASFEGGSEDPGGQRPCPRGRTGRRSQKQWEKGGGVGPAAGPSCASLEPALGMRHPMAAPDRPRLGVVTRELTGGTGQRQAGARLGRPAVLVSWLRGRGLREGVVAAAPNDPGRAHGGRRPSFSKRARQELS